LKLVNRIINYNCLLVFTSLSQIITCNDQTQQYPQRVTFIEQKEFTRGARVFKHNLVSVMEASVA